MARFYVLEVPENEGVVTVASRDPMVTVDQVGPYFRISADGTISVRDGASKVDTARGKLRLVTFAKPQQMQKDGGSTFKPGAGDAPQATATARIEQGAVEKSNVRGVVEMSRMIEITRAYTQVATLLQQPGDLSQQSIDKLAEVPT